MLTWAKVSTTLIVGKALNLPKESPDMSSTVSRNVNMPQSRIIEINGRSIIRKSGADEIREVCTVLLSGLLQRIPTRRLDTPICPS